VVVTGRLLHLASKRQLLDMEIISALWIHLFLFPSHLIHSAFPFPAESWPRKNQLAGAGEHCKIPAGCAALVAKAMLTYLKARKRRRPVTKDPHRPLSSRDAEILK